MMESKNIFFFLFIYFLKPWDSFSQTTHLPFSKNAFIVIAHRGDHTNAPENTLAAYQNAIDAGVDFVEIDLRMTKDSQLVILHNATIDNMTGSSGRVKNMSFDSLRLLKIREKQHPEWGFHTLPTFKEVLNLCKGKINIYLDFKEAPVDLAYKEIVEAGMEHNIVVYINAPQQFKDWRKIAPEMPLMISLPKAVKTKQEMIQLIDTYKMDILDGNYDEYNTETVLATQQRKIPIWADIQAADEGEERWERAINLGIKALQTDRPKALIDFLKMKGIR